MLEDVFKSSPLYSSMQIYLLEIVEIPPPDSPSGRRHEFNATSKREICTSE